MSVAALSMKQVVRLSDVVETVRFAQRSTLRCGDRHRAAAAAVVFVFVHHRLL